MGCELMSKHAYLIMAHNNFDFLKKELELLDDERNDIFIHIDKKAGKIDEDYIRDSVKKSKVFFIERMSVNWGGYSIAVCTLNLIKSALENDDYRYFHLLSGADLPIKSQDYIHNFFDEHDGLEFVAFDRPVPREIDVQRVRIYYLFQDIYGRNHKVFPYVLLYAFDKLFVKIQKLLHVNRFKKERVMLQKGPEWFSITNELAELMLKKRKWIEKHFKYTRCCDEVFLQTVLANSSRRKHIYQDGLPRETTACLRKIDWGRGKPYTWTSNEFDELCQSKCLFARKFDPNVDQMIIDRMVELLKKD